MEEDSNRICQYHGGGCKAIFLAIDKLSHEEICMHRPCGCPFLPLPCPWQGRIIQVAEHLSIAHQLVVKQGAMVVFTVNRIHVLGETYWQMLQACFDNHFMLVLHKRETPEGFLRCFVQAQLLGSRQKAQGFNCRMEVQGRGGRRMAWEGKAHCIEDDVLLANNATDCLQFYYTDALVFAENWKLHIVVTITVSE